MAFTKKIAGWVAGRIKGEKARKDTMRWMEKTGLGQILDIAGDAALISGAVKGAGALKGMLTGGAKTAATAAPTVAQQISAGVPLDEAGNLIGGGTGSLAQGAGSAARSGMGGGITSVAPRVPTAVTPPSTAPMPSATLPMQAGRAATGVGSRVASTVTPPAAPPALSPTTVPKPSMFKKVLTGAGEAGAAVGRGLKSVPKEAYAYGLPAISQSMAISRQTALEEEQARLEQERRNRLAQLLMPMFQAEVQRYGQSTRG